MDLLGGRMEDRLILGRVSVRGERMDPVAARLSVESALLGADVTFPGLLPGAIVCIRSLDDPLPRQVRADRPSPRPPRAWQSALSRKLEEVCRRAARPWLAPVPAGAVAVLFEGRAELFACLLRDLVTGSLHDGWWYPDVLGGAVSRETILAALRVACEDLPGAVALLATRRAAAALAGQLTPQEARSLAAALVQRFGLTGVARAAERAARRGVDEAGAVETEEAGSGQCAAPGDVPVAWAPAAPETTSLRRAGQLAQELFLGLALTLAREPETARRPPFSERAGSLWAAAAISTLDTPAGDVESSTIAGATPQGSDDRPAGTPPAQQAPSSAQGGRRAEGAAPPAPPVEPAPPAGASTAAAHATRGADSHATPADPFDAWVKAALKERPAPPPPDTAPAPEARPGEAPAPAISPATDAEIPVDPHRARRVFGAPVDTRFGGLFFLVNLGVALDLYADFTTPMSVGIDLSIWDFVTLVGRELLGDALDPSDPVLALLASLAGRAPGEPPGEGWDPPDEWRVPPAWLRPFGGDPLLEWSELDGRTQARHPAGFLAVDVPAGRQATSEPAAALSHTASIQRWLGWLLPYVQARLSLAMPADPGVDRGRLLCAVPATVHAGEAHLDVVMSLAELPIEVRLSGLDRDPGWVPAAGRHVAFHFS
jgi:hypothetical protein